MSRQLLIVDLEATCWAAGEHRPGLMETIEIGALCLVIRARAAHAAGVEFHAPEPSHYLARSVPPEFIEFPA